MGLYESEDQARSRDKAYRGGRAWRPKALALGVVFCFFVTAQYVSTSFSSPVTLNKSSAAETFTSLVVEVVYDGDRSTYPKRGDAVTVNYVGTLASTGAKFDSSFDRTDTFRFNLGVGEVIKGWDEGVAKMSLNETARLYIPSQLGYGASGAGDVIPPNADLIFDVHLIAINGVQMSPKVSIQEITPGDGETYPSAGDKVTVHYVGTFVSGDKFDSSRDRNNPFSFTLGSKSVIRGWEEGIPQLSIGQVARLSIPYQLAYGEQGRQGIPPKADLVFEVELLAIEKASHV
ncbi:hypothetical protein H257_16071 [Aphanomyces astaci]|uniref:peptidylprolyl isomerase n=1 Tax=Aphanomyces astaci TaxID=112090 RepID=W4FK18_APHAT|nr:hypothetical protein H257_16071 [Aphanomyces astaci]ETV67835.1 hypothetical protein H257_16071 [Aphanomyces astaci]|eukprot:XP_009842693.1 hypothetical protein H257_16071 [Aphanomyces astaci]